MITGFNTDVKFGETIYHVQTEDKGEAHPLIESLVYIKGQILDSFRTSYEEYFHSNDYSQSILQKILENQHRQLVSAIKHGQFLVGMDLKDYADGKLVLKLGSHRVGAASRNRPVPVPVTPGAGSESRGVSAPEIPPAKIPDIGKPRKGEEPITHTAVTRKEAHQTVAQEQGGVGPWDLGLARTKSSLEVEQGIEIKLDSEKVFVAGSHVDLSLSVQSRSHGTRLESVQVVIKVIGTSFSPRLYAGKTDRNGNLRISFNLPNYTMGSAALIVQAHTALGADEVKYLIRKK